MEQLDIEKLSTAISGHMSFLNTNARDYLAALHPGQNIAPIFVSELPLLYTATFVNSVMRTLEIGNDFDLFISLVTRSLIATFNIPNQDALELAGKAAELAYASMNAPARSVENIVARAARRHAAAIHPTDVKEEYLDVYALIMLSIQTNGPK